MKTFFGFALADSMFSGDTTITRQTLTATEAADVVKAGVVSCLNPSHQATIQAAKERFGIEVDIPATPPQVQLHPKDSLVVMGVRGLPRLTDRHEYTAEEVMKATFLFSRYTVG